MVLGFLGAPEIHRSVTLARYVAAPIYSEMTRRDEERTR